MRKVLSIIGKIYLSILTIVGSIILLGGAIYYLLDYDKVGDNDFIQSTIEFSEDLIDKVKVKIDSSETYKDFRKN